MRFGDHWPLKAFWKDRLGDHKKVLHEFIDPIVVAAVERKKAAQPVVDPKEETLLQNLVNSTEGASKKSRDLCVAAYLTFCGRPRPPPRRDHESLGRWKRHCEYASQFIFTHA